MRPLFKSKKCELLRSIERALLWQDVEEKIMAIKLAHSQRLNRNTAKELERKGAL